MLGYVDEKKFYFIFLKKEVQTQRKEMLISVEIQLINYCLKLEHKNNHGINANKMIKEKP
jgi:hypothetical protein